MTLLPETYLILAGITLCLAGWLLYLAGLKIVAGIFGGVVGSITAFFLVFLFNINHPSFRNLLFLLMFVGGIVAGVYLSRKLHKFLFFLVGASVGALLAYISAPYAIEHQFLPPDSQVAAIFFHLIWVILGGFIAVAISGYLLCIVTPLLGILLLASGLHISEPKPAMIIIWLSSVLFQYASLRLLKPPKEES